MRTLNVSTDQSKRYLTAGEALADKGYNYVGTITYRKRSKEVTGKLYEKNGKLYVYKGMSHFNTIIEHVRLGRVSTLQEPYEIWR